MKTNAFKYLKLALMAVLMINLTSCEVEIDSFYDDADGGYYDYSAALCSRTWVDNYRDLDGNACHQELDFYSDRTGVDYIEVRYPNGRVQTFEYSFRWTWNNSAQTSLRMDYGYNDVSYLDDVYIGGNTLSGYLNGRNNFVEYLGRK